MSHEHGDEKEIMKKKENSWLEQQVKANKLKNQGAPEFFSRKNLPEIDSLFMDTKEELCCIDEGVANIEDHTNKMSMAGSGILFPANSYEERLNRIAELCINKNITEITSHDGCGAAKIAWNKDGGETGTGIKSPDEYGKKWSKDLTKRINEKLLAAGKSDNAAYKNLDKNQMTRPSEFHDARAVWFDATGEFNPYSSKNIPQGFLIDYGLAKNEGENKKEKKYPFDELKIAINIAFGEHGLGNKFTAENPFIIVVVSKDESELKNLKEKIAKKIKEDKDLKTNADKIKIDGFVKQK